MIETLDSNHPVVYFYELIKLGADESGKGLYESLISQFQKDNFEELVKQKLFVVATDGASSMISPDIGLIKYLGDFAYNPIFKIHCLSHSLVKYPS